MKKVIEQGKGYLGVQHLTETISVYQRFGLNPKGVFILIDKPKAREVALAICPELESELAEKDKEIERLKELLKTRLYDIDFSGNVLARIEITNNHPTIIGAMNGYGDAIAPSNCSISLNK